MQKKQTFTALFGFFLFLSLAIFLLRSVLPLEGFTQRLVLSLITPRNTQQQSDLEKENKTLKEKLAKLLELEKENSALKDQFATTNIPSKKLLPAHIVGMPRFLPSVSQPETIILDKGKADQVKVGSIVVYQKNLIGKVVFVSEHLSKVDVLTNTSSSFTAVTQKNNALGIIKGKGEGVMLLDNVSLSEKLEKGEVVVTKGDVSEDGSGYVPNLIVGQTVSIEKKPSNLFAVAKVKSDIDVSHLLVVFILQ